MRISGQHITGIQKAYNQENKAEKREEAGLAQQKDKVAISSDARLFSVALQTLRELPDMDAKKIEELRTQLREDKYEVSNEDLAEKICDEMFKDE